MSSKTFLELLDDIDGSPADETVEFGLGPARYEIDLNEAHARQLRNALDRFIAAGREVRPPPKRRSTASRQRSRAIREWAIAEGHTTVRSGRLSVTTKEKWKLAHPGQ